MFDSAKAFASIRSAPFDGNWPEALAEISTAGGGWAGQLVAVTRAGEVLYDIGHRIPLDLLTDFERRGGVDQAVNPRAAVLSRRPFEILGRLYYSEGQWESAYEEITKARKLNPFDRGLAEISGRVQFELKNFDQSLEDFIDAFLLATDQKGESTEPVRRMINTLKRINSIETKDLNARIKDRVEQLQVATERLELRKENLFRLESRKDLKDIVRKISRDAEKRDNLITISAELRKLQVFQHMKDEQIFRLSKFTRIEEVASGGYIFR